MPVNDTAIGGALIIPEDLLKNLDKVDEKIKRIQETSRATADVFNQSFASMSARLSSGLLAGLQQVMTQLGQIGSVTKSVSSATQGMGSGIGNAAQQTASFGTSITSVTEAINRMVGAMQKTGSTGTGAMQAATLASERLQAAMQGKTGMNIAELKQVINSYTKSINDISRNLSKETQDRLVKERKALQDELKFQLKTITEREVAYQQSLDRMVKAEEAFARRQQQAQKRTAQDYQRQNYSTNTTYQGSLNFADTANTINRRTQAIKYLTEARNALSKTDTDYANKLFTLNSRIKELNAANRQAVASSQELNSSHRKLMDTAGQLQRAFALVFSVSQIRGYIDTIAKVRGEFELNQRSLESILQNKTEADTIFNKTVALAVQSPFSIRQLVSYTKELAAYRIESDKLYDTTKRLADVSAGLGVDMGRLILAYGQVKAAAYLRGSEVRQFTEAGVNMYGELQRYFQEVKGEAYTTAEIVDMISKRMVTFEDVEEVFKRITSQGGIFYRMQEIQAETLQGKIANFKDSVDVMMNEIGKANEGIFKGTLDTATALMGNWETIASVGKTLIEVVAALVISYKILNGSFGAAAQNAMKQAKHLGVLKGMMAALTGQATKLGTSLKAAFSGALPLLGLTAAIELFSHLISVQREYNKAQKEAENKYYQGQVRTSEIENLAVTIDDKTSKPKIKEALNALVKEMNNEGFNIELNVNLSEEEAKKQYDESLKQHKQYLDDMLRLDYQYNLDKKNNSWFWQTDADEANTNLQESYQKALATIAQVRTELAKVADCGTGLDSAMRKELEALEQGVTESGSLEAMQDYYTQLTSFLEKIKSSYTYTAPTSIGVFSTTTNTFAGIQSSILESVKGVGGALDLAQEEMTGKIRSLFDSIFNFKNYDNDVKAAMVNNKATALGWNMELVQQIASSLYNIDFSKPQSGSKQESANNTNAKLQRDILAERISLVKELNQEYEKLGKVMGDDKAAETVMNRYASALKDVQMPKNIIGDSFIPDKESTAKALQEMAKTITDFRKKIGAEKDAWQLLDKSDIEKAKEKLDEIKNYAQNLFSQKDLHGKLSDFGLTDAQIQQMFGISAKSFEDIRKAIEESYAAIYGTNKVDWGTDVTKQYESEMKDLDKRIYSEQVSQAQELLKAYKTQLSDQLQLDKWYYEERRKIQENEQIQKDPELARQLEGNLTKEYSQKTDVNTWKSFQNSDEYIKIFENLDYTSTSVLEKTIEKLEGMKDSLKNLPPDQLKTIVGLIEDLKGETLDRNPIKGIARALKDLKNAKPEDKQKAIADLGTAFETASSKISQFNSAFGEVSSMLSSFGIDIPEEISGALSGMSQAFSGASEFATSYATGNVFGMVTGGLKTIAGIGNTIGSIFGFGNKDKKLQKEIEKQQEIVETLQRAYDKLKESMDNAWSATNVIQANNEAIDNIKAQIASYQKMVNAERDKKKTDEDKIKEWQNQIDDLKDTLAELEEQMIETFGGFGTEANYKSAAQEFADAWVDAFNESENTLEALEETFDDYFNNMLKKQLMQRAAQKYLQPIFDAFDKAVSEGSAGGNKGYDVTAGEIAKIQQLKDSQLKAFDEYAKALMEMLGVKPNGSSTGELSKLQQGIQSLTESTGQALESLLNSIRFFVAQQTTDVSAIRALLQQSNSIDVSTSTDTPMLTELKAQTSYLKSIDSRLEKVIKISGHPKSGAGIKVFLD